MDGIQPYDAQQRTPVLHTTPVHGPSVTPTRAAKTGSDYVRALRRRIWIVLAIGVPLSILGAIVVVRMPNVYKAQTQILIESPEFDPYVSRLLEKTGQRESEGTQASYVANRIALLRSKRLAEQVVNDPSVTQGSAPPPEAADELIGAIQTRDIRGTGQFTVSLEGTDPARTAKQLTLLLEAFREQADSEIRTKIDDSKSYAQDSLKQLRAELDKLHNKVDGMLRNSDTIGPGGKNLKQTQYETLTSVLLHKHTRLTELQQQSWLSQSMPSFQRNDSVGLEVKIADLEEVRAKYHDQLSGLRRRVRSFDSDPAVKVAAERLQQTMDKITRLQAMAKPRGEAVDPYEALVETMKTEIRADEEAATALLAQMQESMPQHQQFLDLLEEQRLKLSRMTDVQTNLWEFEMVSKSRRKPVTILADVAEPVIPIRPKRALYLVAVFLMSFGLGIGLVCLGEHVDHSVKTPEQLTAGLSLPLFGVVPRIRRTALVHRGGHLWTPGIPDSIEADAYRNLRASLLGVSDRRGPLVTLLVTSAKAGEGKSTTALNLAATCARAGERTLLMDVDLRRPSLAGVFQDADVDEPPLGLVDVLRGDLPWQRTVVRADIPNLDFLPTGDPRGVPIEILGTLELRQLVIGLSNHYDRVILDGPAILGLADCRMLGRIVDAAVLVVRSGSQELRPLLHAKSMLEQSHVVIAGVVFNGLNEDLQHWSSYGPDTPYVSSEGLPPLRRSAPTAGLDGQSEAHAPLPLAGSARS